MHLVRCSENPILERNPKHSWEAGSVLNPTVIYEDGVFKMLYRATNDVHSNKQGRYVSSIGYAESPDGIHFTRRPEPLIAPDQPYERGLGCEDPRVTKIDDTYYIFYTAVHATASEAQARIALATSKDLKTVTKHGLIGPSRYSKAASLLPRRIGSNYGLLWADQEKNGSRIIYTEFPDLDQLLNPEPSVWTLANIDSGHVAIPPQGLFKEQEVGARPIETPDGWLLVYSGFQQGRQWNICAALLDINDPRRVIGSLPEPILLPETAEERLGVVNNVCFPEGAAVVGDELFVYYGSGDQDICLATCKLSELISTLKTPRP